MGYRLLVIESDAVPADASVCSALADDGLYRCQPVRWDDMTPQTLDGANAHAVVAVAVPHTSRTTAVFDWLRSNPIATPMFAVLGSELEGSVLRSVCEAVDDFVFSPLRPHELRHRLARVLGASRHAAEVEMVRQRLLDEMGMSQLVGDDPAFVSAITHVPRFARSEMPILITGETGTGKELCARAIHHLSKRRDLPFVAIDCGTIPDHLFENELFGHVRGAFTDAHRDQRGLVAMAEGGTLFLDEVDALSMRAQTKLLRLLQERTYRPLGSDRFQTDDINVIAATNRDLEACVRAQQFRSDLYFRLNVLRLQLPALRERPQDIGLLARHFLDARSAAATRLTLSAGALRALARHDWPGNVRELHNIVQRASVVCDGRQIVTADLALPQPHGEAEPSPTQFRAARAAAVDAFERRYLEELLHRHHGNVTHAARAAGKDRRVFGRLIKRHGINRQAL